jgi:hypothetical protein
MMIESPSGVSYLCHCPTALHTTRPAFIARIWWRPSYPLRWYWLQATSSPAGHRKNLRIPCSPAISISPVTTALPLCHFSSDVVTAYTTAIRMCSPSTATPYVYVVNGQWLPYPTPSPGHPQNSPLPLRLNKLSPMFGHSDLGPPGNTNWIYSQSMSKEPPLFSNIILFAISTSRNKRTFGNNRHRNQPHGSPAADPNSLWTLASYGHRWRTTNAQIKYSTEPCTPKTDIALISSSLTVNLVGCGPSLWP